MVGTCAGGWQLAAEGDDSRREPTAMTYKQQTCFQARCSTE